MHFEQLSVDHINSTVYCLFTSNNPDSYDQATLIILSYFFLSICQNRTLREKTTLAVTSKGRFGAEEERGSGGTSTRRRLAPRSLATITVGGHESIMVQTLRLEEQQRAKDEKR